MTCWPLLFIYCAFWAPGAARAASVLSPDNLFTHGALGYDSLLVSPKFSALYVGASGHLFKLWLYNLNDTSLSAKRVFSPNAEDLDECLHTGAAEQDCAVRVREQFLKQDGSLLVCVSNAMKPQLHQLDGAGLKQLAEPRGALGVCSPHADLNTTAVFVESGNPDDIPAIYSGIRTGPSLENHLIYRPPLVFNNRELHPALKSIYTDSKWLNEPQFVASFGLNQYVYFFFREVAVETDNCGRNVYSRVARVCKNDLGGKNVLRQVWTSFVKARLNCSTGGSSPFYFNHLKSMTLVQQGAEQVFFGVFSSAENALQSSAVCSFGLRAIDQLLDTGVFLEQPVVNSVWLPTPAEQAAPYRPGACVPDSRASSDSELHFAKSHLLLAEAVPARSPAFVFEGESLREVLADSRDGQTVLFVHNPGRRLVHKLLHWAEQQPPIRRLHSYALPAELGPANSLALLPGEYLYVASDRAVAQYRLGQCGLHLACAGCSADPYCSWNIARSECFSRDSVHATAVGWISGASSAHRCRSYVRSVSRRLFPGDGALLECPLPEADWKVDNVPVAEDSAHLVLARAGGLVLLNVTRAQSGTYQCVHEGMPAVEYMVLVDDADCSRPKSVAQFHSAQREWCKKLEFYKSNVSKWQKWYGENNECPRIPSELEQAANLQKAAMQ